MKDYKLIIQNTTDKRYFITDFTDQEDSKIYYHIESFVFPDGYQDGEYRYYVLPMTDKEITLDNDIVYFDGKVFEPLATGFIILGEYKNPNVTYNKKETYIQYE